MTFHTEINAHLSRLCAAAEAECEPCAEGPGGPLTHLKRAVATLPLDDLTDRLPRFEGTWLHALVCQVQGRPVAGSMIIEQVFPPAAMLAEGYRGDAAERDLIRAGAVVSIRPPANDLLVLSPATAAAAVYSITGEGLKKLGDSVVHFVAAQVDEACAPPPERTDCDEGQLGALVIGRRFFTERTYEQAKAAQATAAEWRKKSGLPLVFVNPGPAQGDDDETAAECFFAGLLVACAEDGGQPRAVNKALLDVAKLAAIPDGFWVELNERHGLSPVEEDDEAGASEGLFLVPAGWAVASLKLGDKKFTTTSSEDTYVGKRISEEQLGKINASTDALMLDGTYC